MTDAEYKSIIDEAYRNMLLKKDSLYKLQRIKMLLLYLICGPRLTATGDAAAVDKMINWNREYTIKVLP